MLSTTDILVTLAISVGLGMLVLFVMVGDIYLPARK